MTTRSVTAEEYSIWFWVISRSGPVNQIKSHRTAFWCGVGGATRRSPVIGRRSPQVVLTFIPCIAETFCLDLKPVKTAWHQKQHQEALLALSMCVSGSVHLSPGQQVKRRCCPAAGWESTFQLYLWVCSLPPTNQDCNQINYPPSALPRLLSWNNRICLNSSLMCCLFVPLMGLKWEYLVLRSL